MPPNPKRPSTVEFNDEQILKADDPRPQRVAQYPSSNATGARRALKKEEHIPTALYDTEADQEMQAEYGAQRVDFKPVFLYVERGPGAGQLLEVKQGSVVIGRASVSDLRLQHPSISRRHAQIRRVGEQFFVKDLGSQNGTFVNKERIAGEVETKPGDSLALGNALVRLRGPLTKDERGSPTGSMPAAPTVKPAASPASINKERIATGLVARPSSPLSPVNSGNALKIAVLAGAIGFGLAAALAFALIRAMASPAPTVASVTPNDVAPSSASTPPERVNSPGRDRLIDDALKRKMAEQRARPDPVTAAPEIDEAPVIVKDGRAPAPAHPSMNGFVGAQPQPVRRAPAPAPVASARPAPKADEEDAEEPAAKSSGGASRAQLLASYEKGNAESSLEAAKKANDKDLVSKLSNFIQAYDAANDAMMANNGTAAIVNFQKALSIDDQLSNGWGKYGSEIRRKLANLYVLVGIQHNANGDEDSARKAFQAALKHDPSNDRAKQQLEKIGGGGAPAAAAKSNPDDAFEDPPAATPAPSSTRRAITPKKAPAKSSSSIDDAFGD